ncbi:NUDIX domain-containing protein [Rhizobium sp. ARZ01]|uniref:NUDIX domain-containing protein n=1 Tax=Rhizobium sp. ARZ01 TaxID=2769313 RepID=UPI00177DCA85|nr:NUDIX domain-containing protein [Rhizobium sp. ARZ01]MBD9371737.1 NUDIX domain-containing protein [Rhizobium sp. ARZ01]
MTKFRDTKIEIVSDKTLSDNWYHLRNVTFDYTGADGETVRMKREVYDRGNGATILLHDPKRDTIILVRQFRMPAHQNGHSGWLLETPAGLLDGEHPADVIRREVMEETGYRIDEVKLLFKVFMSPGAVTETIHFFAATIDASIREGEGGGLDHEHEDIEVVEVKLDDAARMIETGEICDAKTIMLIQWALLQRK